MSKKQWMVLLMLFLTYLLLGAFIFYHIESPLEIEHVKKAKQERIEINALLQKHYIPSQIHDYEEILGKLTRYCGKSVYNYTEGETDPLKWDFYNSFYFAYTVVSTIGYGNLAPTNMLGRILMIFYGLIGIPMNGILLTQLGEFFGHVFVRAHRKYKSYKHGRDGYYPKKMTSFETRKIGLAAQIFAYLTPGFVMFIFFPAFLFSHYEGWTYDEAVYYAFVTLTTIGFGDYVAGQDNSKGSGILFILYKTFLICWISFGLGYVVMIMTFIARGMRSKKITRIEHKLALNLKHTQSKIWNEFNKEINYLRRVFNELQLSKVKRVYVDECEYETPPTKLSRSNSFPNLRDLSYGGYADNSVSQRPRRRANSEVVPMEHQVARVVSETDLQRIDKTATFAAHAMVQPAELLARLVNILGYIPPSDDVGDSPPSREREVDNTYVEQESRREMESVDQARDATQFDTWKDVLKKRAISTGSPWTMGNERIPQSSRPRSRAASEVRLYETKNEGNAHNRNVEWTWSGPAATRKIQELITARTIDSSACNGKDTGSTKTAKYRTLALAKSVPRALFPRWRRQLSSGKKNADHESGLPKPADKEDTEKREERRYSLSGKPYYTHTGANTSSSLGEGSHLLEETSLADFLRALTVLHASVGTVPDEYAHKPRRKMGIASLTPPKLPSLFTLFSSPHPATTQSNNSTITGTQRALRESSRRLSLGPTDNKYSDGFSTSALRPRMQSTAIAPKPRRFSLRPVATPVSPPTPPRNESPTLSHLRRESNADRTAPPLYQRDTFLFESPKEPLIQREGAPGVSSPMIPPSNSRRLSLRPMQTGLPIATTVSSVSPSKGMPRWKAGALQRQIGQMNLRRRARAFSLSDVQSDDSGKNHALSSGIVDTTSKTSANKEPPDIEEISTVRKSVTLSAPNDTHIVNIDEHPNESPSSDRSISPDLSVGSTPFAVSSIAILDTVTSSRSTIHQSTPLPRKPDQQTDDVPLRKFHDEGNSAKTRTSSSMGRENDGTNRNVKSSIGSDTPSSSPTLVSPENKPTVSIGSFEPLLEVKVQKPTMGPAQRYKAAIGVFQKGHRAESAEAKAERDAL